jgi:hypothetical protein
MPLKPLKPPLPHHHVLHISSLLSGAGSCRWIPGTKIEGQGQLARERIGSFPSLRASIKNGFDLK